MYKQYLSLLRVEHLVVTDLAAVSWPMSAILKSSAHVSKVWVMLAVTIDDAQGHWLLLWVLWCPYGSPCIMVSPQVMDQVPVKALDAMFIP